MSHCHMIELRFEEYKVTTRTQFLAGSDCDITTLSVLNPPSHEAT